MMKYILLLIVATCTIAATYPTLYSCSPSQYKQAIKETKECLSFVNDAHNYCLHISIKRNCKNETIQIKT